MKLKQKPKNEKLLESKFIDVLIYSTLVFLIVFLSVSHVRIFQKRADLRSQIQDKRTEIESLYLKKEGTDYEINSDEYNIERIAREQLLMKKEGEEVVFLTSQQEVFSEQEKEDKKEVESFVWWNPFTWKNKVD